MAKNYIHLLHTIFIIIITFMSLVTANNPSMECSYPCFPPPIPASDCPPVQPTGSPPPPPPPSPGVHYPPPPSGYYPPPEWSGYYPPPDGYIPYFTPPEYVNYNAPPPPNPILPYFPFYYKNPPPPPEDSSAVVGVAGLPIKRFVSVIVLHLCFFFFL